MYSKINYIIPPIIPACGHLEKNTRLTTMEEEPIYHRRIDVLPRRTL